MSRGNGCNSLPAAHSSLLPVTCHSSRLIAINIALTHSRSRLTGGQHYAGSESNERPRAGVGGRVAGARRTGGALPAGGALSLGRPRLHAHLDARARLGAS